MCRTHSPEYIRYNHTCHYRKKPWSWRAGRNFIEYVTPISMCKSMNGNYETKSLSWCPIITHWRLRHSAKQECPLSADRPTDSLWPHWWMSSCSLDEEPGGRNCCLSGCIGFYSAYTSCKYVSFPVIINRVELAHLEAEGDQNTEGWAWDVALR